jgi:tetratricopeptide (TPR) repeat protein
MGGKRKKNKNEKKKTPQALKESGNNAFMAGDYELAHGYYSKALEQEPENGIIRCNRAAVLIEQHKYDQAIEDLNVSMRVDPSYLKAYYRMAVCYREVTNFPATLDFINQGLALAPESADLLELQNET